MYHNKTALLLHLWEIFEDHFWHSTIMLTVTLTRQNEVLLVLRIFCEQLADIVSHRIVLDKLSLEHLLVLWIRLQVQIVHISATYHRLKHIIVVVRTLQRLHIGCDIVLQDRLLQALILALPHQSARVGPRDETGVQLHNVFVLLGVLQDGCVGF